MPPPGFGKSSRVDRYAFNSDVTVEWTNTSPIHGIPIVSIGDEVIEDQPGVIQGPRGEEQKSKKPDPHQAVSKIKHFSLDFIARETLPVARGRSAMTLFTQLSSS